MSGIIAGCMLVFTGRTTSALAQDRNDLHLSASACLRSEAPRASCRENSTFPALTLGRLPSLLAFNQGQAIRAPVRSGGRMPPGRAGCGKIDDDARSNLRKSSSMTHLVASDPASLTSVYQCKMYTNDISCLTLHLSRKIKALEKPIELAPA